QPKDMSLARHAVSYPLHAGTRRRGASSRALGVSGRPSVNLKEERFAFLEGVWRAGHP
ncbi:MAG: hypothetical protein QOE72_4655, partial [Chloroflexota bacterium]|nr:hypothetical protein [Chloroflexota bacterium]